MNEEEQDSNQLALKQQLESADSLNDRDKDFDKELEIDQDHISENIDEGKGNI